MGNVAVRDCRECDVLGLRLLQSQGLARIESRSSWMQVNHACYDFLPGAVQTK